MVEPLLLLLLVSLHPFLPFYANNLEEGFGFADLAPYAAATFAAAEMGPGGVGPTAGSALRL